MTDRVSVRLDSLGQDSMDHRLSYRALTTNAEFVISDQIWLCTFIYLPAPVSCESVDEI